jgi:peptidoglycan hydrolase-like protein with peptidoglycan-binding domain
MNRLRLASGVACACLVLLAPAAANAVAAPPPPAPAPTTPSTPLSAPAPAVGRIQLVVQKASGKPPFAIAGGGVVIRGIVVPYVGGQQVKVSVYRDGRKVEVKTVGVEALGNGAGQFHLAYSSANSGEVQVRAAHYATAQQAAFAGRSETIHFVSPDLHEGDSGASVRLLQSELNALHFVVPLDGVFDEATGRAVIAYRKMTGLARVPNTNLTVFKKLQEGAGTFHVKYPQDGRHVEGDLTRQVLAEIEPGGKVDSNYFIRGYAIHGYAEVPTYAASHGCLRVPIPNALAIYGWVQYGTPVDVYNESGGGSHTVKGNAGP